MSVTFGCGCGARYTVGDHLAGKLVRCKQCGERLRIPAAAPPPAAAQADLDLYGLADDPPASRSTPVTEEPPASTSPRGARKDVGKRPASRWKRASRGFLESIPRDHDLRLPSVGVAALVATIGLVISGGKIAMALLGLLGIAVMVTFLWACLSGLAAAARQGVLSALILLPALFATGAVCWLVIRPNSAIGETLAWALMALVFYSGFFLIERRGEAYRRPIAIGAFSALLVLSLTIMTNVVRQRLATGGITPQDIEQAAAPAVPGPSAGSTAAAPAPSPAALVARALERKASLPEARRVFRPRPLPPSSSREPIEVPPPDLFSVVQYDSPVGKLSAYLSPDPGDGRKRPAILWIHGGDSKDLGDVWSPYDESNEQSASAYRKAGIVMMFPSLRGGNDNPGTPEAFYGEVDDILAAADYLAAQPHVDPRRIYLGGHSTGGTLVLLAAECTDRFRAVFSFGPASDVRGYGPRYAPFDTSDLAEAVVRSPSYWLHSVGCPTFVIEGEGGNIDALRGMQSISKNPLIRFHPVAGTDHFEILGPVNQMIARKIVNDRGPTTDIAFTPDELNRPFGR